MMLEPEKENYLQTDHCVKYRDTNTRSRGYDTAITTVYRSGVQFHNKILKCLILTDNEVVLLIQPGAVNGPRLRVDLVILVVGDGGEEGG